MAGATVLYQNHATKARAANALHTTHGRPSTPQPTSQEALTFRGLAVRRQS